MTAIHGWMSLGRSSRTVETAVRFKHTISLAGGGDAPRRVGPARFVPSRLADASGSATDAMTSQRRQRIPEDRAADAMLALAMKGFGDVTAYQAGGAAR